ncbi:MAG: hypothetical protein PF488_03355 [Patescibacteria group bacterium]|jgi:hypothetical protein|nr:hypothetical protein [Patescibacteria group bacterium]
MKKLILFYLFLLISTLVFSQEKQSEFESYDLTVGQLNDVVKNIMDQTGIEDPKEAVRMINAGELSISKSRWREENGVIYFSVTSDGITGEEWITRLENKGFRISSYAKRVLRSIEFELVEPTTYKMAVLKREIFSDNDKIIKNVRKEARSRKLSTPNIEVACLIREKFSDEDLKAMDLYWIIAMHEPIKNSSGDPELLSAGRGGNGSWLDAYYGGTGGWWGHSLGFAFVVRQVRP